VTGIHGSSSRWYDPERVIKRVLKGNELVSDNVSIAEDESNLRAGAIDCLMPRQLLRHPQIVLVGQENYIAVAEADRPLEVPGDAQTLLVLLDPDGEGCPRGEFEEDAQGLVVGPIVADDDLIRVPCLGKIRI
jgi:hypothetical protein